MALVFARHTHITACPCPCALLTDSSRAMLPWQFCLPASHYRTRDAAAVAGDDASGERIERAACGGTHRRPHRRHRRHRLLVRGQRSGATTAAAAGAATVTAAALPTMLLPLLCFMPPFVHSSHVVCMSFMMCTAVCRVW